MTGGDLPSLTSSMREPDFMELVWENGEVLTRSLSSKMNKNSLSQSSKDEVVADCTLVDPLAGLSSLTKQCYDKQLVDSSIVPLNKLKEKRPRIDEDKDSRVNFSLFLRSPQALIESNHPSSCATRAMSSQGLAPGAEPSLPPMSSTPFENDGDKKMKSILPDSEPQKESLVDELSEAVPNTKLAPDDTGFKRSNPQQMIASSSFCSRGASNCPTYTSRRRYEEDTDDLSKNTEMDEPKGTTKGSKGGKRKRKTEVHNLSERKRRDKINKKMRALKELIPNCNKVDKASMLDEAIEYLKNLQFQVQMMSIGNGVYMQPMMFPSPSALQHLGGTGYSPMMGMRMPMGLPPQFPPSIIPAAGAPPGIPEGRFNMFGFPDEVLLSRSPFVSSTGSFTPQSVQLHGAGVSQSVAAAQVDGQGGANSLTTSKDKIQHN